MKTNSQNPDSDLMQKNKFVLALREHLRAKYQTEHHYTYGEDNFKAECADGVYSLVRKDENKPENISGFCFRKDLCCVPFLVCSADILSGEIREFAKRYPKLKGALKREGNNLEIKFGNQEYLVHSSVEEGYAGNISIYFSK